MQPLDVEELRIIIQGLFVRASDVDLKSSWTVGQMNLTRPDGVENAGHPCKIRKILGT